MLELKVYDRGNPIVLKFEHSLRSLSKWESIYRKPFLVDQHTQDEMISYFQCMLLNKKADPNLVFRLSPEQLEEMTKYINTPQTASSVPKEAGKPSPEQVTSELIYFWMGQLEIDWEAQDWHLSRLMMLIQITNYKKQPPKKQKASDFRDKWLAANARRKKELNSNG